MLVLLAPLSAAGCAPPLQNGGVRVLPGAAERFDAICRWHHGADAELCGAEEPEVAEAEAPVPTH